MNHARRDMWAKRYEAAQHDRRARMLIASMLCDIHEYEISCHRRRHLLGCTGLIIITAGIITAAVMGVL